MKYAFVISAVYVPIALLVAYFTYRCARRRLDLRIRIAGVLGLLVPLCWAGLLSVFPNVVADPEYRLPSDLILLTWPSSLGLMVLENTRTWQERLPVYCLSVAINVLLYATLAAALVGCSRLRHRFQVRPKP